SHRLLEVTQVGLDLPPRGVEIDEVLPGILPGVEQCGDEDDVLGAEAATLDAVAQFADGDGRGQGVELVAADPSRRGPGLGVGDDLVVGSEGANEGRCSEPLAVLLLRAWPRLAG